jgi:hypothetical protein
MLKDQQAILRTPEGRKLFQLAKAKIRDTEWDTVVFQPPQGPEHKKREVILNKAQEAYWEKRHQSQAIINEALKDDCQLLNTMKNHESPK